MASVDPRINRLLTQLEDPDLDQEEIDKIKSKIGFIESLGMRA